MNDSKELENERYQQEMRIWCIDYATRVVGKPEYFNTDGKWEKQQEDVVKVAKQIYEFVKGFIIYNPCYQIVLMFGNVGIRIVADCERKTIKLLDCTNVERAFKLPLKRLLFLYIVSRSVFIY
jgi:hypothetical protein